MKAKAEGNWKKTIIMKSELKRGESCQQTTATTTANTSNSPTGHHTGHNPQGHYNWEKDNWFESKTAEFLSLSALSLLSALFWFLIIVIFFALFNGVISWSASNLKSNHNYLIMVVGTKNGRPCFSGPLLSIQSLPLLSIIQINN